MSDRKKISVVRDDNTPRANAPWKLGITTQTGLGGTRALTGASR